MARRDTKSVLVRMPSELKQGLTREVERRDSTLNDIAVSILARRFDVPFRRHEQKRRPLVPTRKTRAAGQRTESISGSP